MTPDKLNLRIQRGTDTAIPIMLMDSGFRYAPITTIHQTAPLTITAELHGLPAPEWPAWIEGTTSSALNRDKTRQPFQMMRVIDADTLEINSINGTAIRAAGGQIVYHSPLDTEDWQFEADFYAGDDSLLTLSLGSGLRRTAAGIEMTITAADTETLASASRWSLSVTHSAGRQVYLCGSVSVTECNLDGRSC